MGYVSDASKTDKAKYKQYKAGQLCSNCALCASSPERTEERGDQRGVRGRAVGEPLFRLEARVRLLRVVGVVPGVCRAPRTSLRAHMCVMSE